MPLQGNHARRPRAALADAEERVHLERLDPVLVQHLNGEAGRFQLAQALNRLKGKPVLVSKTIVERKAEAATN